MSKRIVNVGICTVDAIGRFVDTYPPRKGLVTFEQLTLATGGNAVNCSIALARLGIGCEVVVKVGNDQHGDFVSAALRKHNVGTRGLIRSDDACTPFTFVAVHHDGERSFIHTPGTNDTLTLDEIDPTIIAEADILFLTGSMVMSALDGEPSAELLRRARQAGAVTMLDTVYADGISRALWQDRIYPCLEDLDYFVPSLPEARHLTGLESVAEIAAEFQRLGCRNVVIKCDADGAFCRDASGVCRTVSAYRIDEVVDSTGAGDTWCAGFLAGLFDGLEFIECVRLGHAVAAHGVQAVGASGGVPSLESVRRFQQTARGGDVRSA